MRERKLEITENKRIEQKSTYEFHVSRLSRDLYQFDDEIFSITGNVVFANFRSARRFADRMNAKRDLARYPETAVKAGDINALALIDEILHYVISQYKETVNPRLFSEIITFLESKLGEKEANDTLIAFVRISG